ncbi:MAG: shikimate kinase [Novosphingobium sp.]|nr:shikimate kinase [Novosphingobium sp.]
MDVDDPRADAGLVAAVARRLDRPVVLVGMMGVGKSSVGKRLAALLRLPFIDADDAIEQAAQMSIPEIFESYGENAFRDGERRVIARLLGACDKRGASSERKVIATGGGAFCQPETRRLILDRAATVWLDCDVDTLVERVGRRDNRPLLRNGNPRETLLRLKTERDGAYAEAPIHVVSAKGPHNRTVMKIVEGLDRWL